MFDVPSLLLFALYSAYFGGLWFLVQRKRRDRLNRTLITREELIRDQHTHARQRLLRRQQEGRR